MVQGNTADFRQTQLQLWQRDDRSTMITTIDIGEKADIHPAYKAPVGERLARAAAAKLYGSAEEYSGPLFDSVRKDGDSLIVKFTHADGNTITVSGSTVETRLLKNTAKAVIARYVSGALASVEIKDIPTVINEAADFSFSIPADGAEKIGVTVLESLTNLRPLNKAALSEINAQ